MVKISAVNKTRKIFMIRLGMVLTLLASLIGFMAASASGETWWPLGGGMDADVYALAYDNSGSVFASGSFTSAGAGSASRIAKWDGSAWSPLGSGVSSDVYALATDGSGNLYAGGAFASAGGVTVNRVARWDGAAWTALGSGMNADVYALAISSGGEVLAGGDFATAGGATVNYIARWDGNSWSPLEIGTNDIVRALALDPNGNIYAGGTFSSAGSLTANRIAGWGSLQPGPIPTPTGLPPNSIVPVTDNPMLCAGESSTVTINLTDVTNLYGYQYIVHYDPSLATASAAFTNTFFDTRTNAIIPPDWNATCAGGECRFAASLMEPANPVSGSGPIAQVRLNGTGAGGFDLTISQDILTDRDSQPIAHATHTLRLNVCSYASVSGTVTLQGRANPIEAGQVTLTDLGGAFGSYTTSFDALTGAFNFNRVKVLPGGSNYQLDAAHGLYLGNRTTKNLQALEAFSAPQTRLAGGDANNDGLIDIGDLACIGGSFGGAPVLCGTTGSSDINGDGKIDILDLVLAGGNYGLTSPGGW